MTTEKQVEKGISEIVGCLTDPIIVFPGGWGDTLPGWMKTSITLERLVENVKALKGEEPTGTDTEAAAYLYTVNLAQPVDHDWAQINLYIATKAYEKWRSKESGVTMPDDVRVDSLNNEQMADLNRLKAWIYHTRSRIRQERDRAERREKKEEAVAQSKAERPMLFDF